MDKLIHYYYTYIISSVLKVIDQYKLSKKALLLYVDRILLVQYKTMTMPEKLSAGKSST